MQADKKDDHSLSLTVILLKRP